MHIREITLEGFRSYKDTTIVSNLSRRHNVVVGCNGSGKSNFFFAIQFVLSNEFNVLTGDARNNLLHEGTGARSTHATVEIHFDNSDRRLPSETDTVVIARVVTTKKDYYTIDKRTVTKTDVLNMLESAGISRSNPYYIVKQGKVMELATAPDSQRLKLIQEVAGTKVYDDKKEESTKLLTETQGKLLKCTELLGHMEARLQKLEEEKGHLKEYQTFDKQRRAIEYRINEHEAQQSRARYDKLAASREAHHQQQQEIEQRQTAASQAITRIDSALRTLNNRYKGVIDENDHLHLERTRLLEEQKNAELRAADLNADLSIQRNDSEDAQNAIERLLEEIQQHEEQLVDLSNQVTQLNKDENKLVTEISILDQQIQELRAKVARSDKFRTAAERDHFLRREMIECTNQIEQAENNIQTIEQAIEDDNLELAELQNEIPKCSVRMNELALKINEKKRLLTQKRTALDELSIKQRDQLVNENQLRESLDSLRAEIAQAEHALSALAPRSTVAGIRSVQDALNYMNQNNENGQYNDVIDGYLGCVIDQFEVDDTYNVAIEVTAEGRLFHHVVTNDRVATALLDYINENQMRGECNFFPLNRLSAKCALQLQEEQDATSLLSLVRYAHQFKPVMEQLFADTFVVPTLLVGARVSRNHRVNCVTIDGDKVNKRGPMTGGFIDRRKSRLEAAKALRKLQEEVAEKKIEYQEAVKQTAAMKKNYDQAALEVSQLENELDELRRKHTAVSDRKREVGDTIHKRAANTEPRREQIEHLKGRMESHRGRKRLLEEQLGSPLTSELTEEERSRLSQLEAELNRKTINLENVKHECQEVFKKKTLVNQKLNANLKRQKERLEQHVQGRNIEDKRDRLDTENSLKKTLQTRINAIFDRVAEINDDLTDFHTEQSRYKQLRQDELAKKTAADQELSKATKEVDNICTKMTELENRLDESQKHLDELKNVPGDTLLMYMNLNAKQLERKLSEVANELKKYEHVNKKALDQFVKAKGHKDKLSAKVAELEQNEASIRQLIEVLNNRRHETLQLTYKQVAKNFSDVFSKLIPGGNAELVMHQVANPTPPQVNGSGGDQFAAVDYLGVGVRVSFTGSGETRDMSHLSGGQKSLVALAMIFAIQKCDPAPFYLFDEVDAALDRQHRQSVASMINEMSASAQFITTTFRPELLEHAEKFYGVTFRNKVSYINITTREEAYDFVGNDEPDA